MPRDNPYQRAARLAKAQKLADFLEAGGISPSMAAMADPGDMALAAQGAGVKMPSEDTWREVIALMEARIVARRVAGPLPEDMK